MNPFSGDPSDVGPVLQPGTRLGGYRIERQLGHGGMGAVFLAYDNSLRRQVAIKILDSDADDEVPRTSLLREARSAATLNHPNICTVYEVGEAGGRAFIAMEYVEGRTFGDLLIAGALPVEEVLKYGREVADALAYAHDRGVIHRDLKVANVISSSAGHVKIVDFGLARRIDSKAANATTTTSPSGPGIAKGTPYAMAPEQVRGGATDARTDVWALGILLYEMLTGSKPFTASSTVDLFSSILRDPPVPLPSRIPGALRDLVYKCLAKDPLHRYQRVADVGLVLETIASALKSPSTGADSVRTPSAFRWRKPAVAAMLLLAIIAAVWAFGWRGQSRLHPWPDALETVAVLPLKNLTGDDHEEYFVNGVTDLLVTRLATIATLRVIPPSSTSRLSSAPGSLAQAAAVLHAPYFLEGSVERSGERMRISVQLITGATGAVRWAQSYERSVRDLFAVEGELASSLAEAISLKLGGRESKLAATRYTTSSDAQDAYLRGRYLLYRFNKSLLPDARREFETAVALDPQFALAHASLSRVYLMSEAYGVVGPQEMEPLASAAALRAVELSPDLSEGHIALAEVRFKINRDWSGADAEYLAGLSLAPQASVARSPYARFLAAAGRPDAALENALAGAAADPLSPEMIATVGISYYYLHRFDEAAHTFTQTIALSPDYGPGFFGRARAESELHQFEAAVRDIQEALRLSGDDASYRAELARVDAAAGWRNSAEQVLGELLTGAKNSAHPVASQDLAYVYAALGERDRALDLLSEALHANYTRVLFIRVDPRVDSLRQEVRFQDLIRELGATR